MVKKELLKRQIKKLIIAVNALDLKEEEKKLFELEALLIQLEQEETESMHLIQQKMQELVKHYENVLAIQKIAPEIQSIQEILDKMG
jgi:hypothetical protein